MNEKSNGWRDHNSKVRRVQVVVYHQHQDAFLYWFKNLGAEMARRGRQTENVRGVSSIHGYHFKTSLICHIFLKFC